MKQNLEQIAKNDGRYDPRALKFVFEALGETIQRRRRQEEGESEPHHITGAELAGGLAALAAEKWGRLARVVLNHWNVKATRDFGEIVYLMIRNNWMTSQETDRIEDFDDVYDFEEVLEKQFTLKIHPPEQ